MHKGNKKYKNNNKNNLKKYETMKTKILDVLSELPFYMVCYAVRSYVVKNLSQLCEKLAFAYTKEDYHRIVNDIANAYHEDLNK